MIVGVVSAPRPRELIEYHERMVEALRVLSRRFEEVVTDAKSPFSGFSRGVFDEALSSLREELDQQVVLVLMGSAEAVIRRDYAARVADPTKTAIHERFRTLDRKYGDRTPFEEILDVWKEEAGASTETGMLKQLYHRRHWLAHGRYYPDKSGVQPYPRNAKNVVEEFVKAVQRHAMDFPRR